MFKGVFSIKTVINCSKENLALEQSLTVQTMSVAARIGKLIYWIQTEINLVTTNKCYSYILIKCTQASNTNVNLPILYRIDKSAPIMLFTTKKNRLDLSQFKMCLEY